MDTSLSATGSLRVMISIFSPQLSRRRFLMSEVASWGAEGGWAGTLS